jgi:hypothetical protein
MSDYGRLVLVFELLSDFEGYRIGYNSEYSNEVIRLAAFKDESELKSFVNQCCKIGVLETDGLGFWSQMITESMKAFEKKQESAKKAAFARWGNVREAKLTKGKEKKEEIVEEREEEITPLVEQFEIGDIDIDLPTDDEVIIDVVIDEEKEPDTPIISSFEIEYERIYNEIRKSKLPKSRHVSLALNTLARRRLRDLKKIVKIEDLEVVIRNAFNDSFHKDSAYKHLTTDFLLRPNIIERYLNNVSEQAKKPKQASDENGTVIKKNW